MCELVLFNIEKIPSQDLFRKIQILKFFMMMTQVMYVKFPGQTEETEQISERQFFIKESFPEQEGKETF